MDKYKVLLVDDDEVVISSVERSLEAEGYDVFKAGNGKNAVKLLRKNTFDLVITELVMGKVNGFDVVKTVKDLHPETITMILTGSKNINYAIDALKIGVDDYLLKPCETEDLLFQVQRCIEKRELRINHEQAEKALKQSEEWLNILFEFAPDAYFLNDLKGIFLDGNRAAEQMVGYKKEELIGKSYLHENILPANKIPKAAALLAQNALGKPTGPDEFTLIHKDGTQVIVEIRTYPINFKNRTIILGIARDISERKRAEEALGESEKRYRQIVETVPFAVITFDTQHNILEWNSAAERIFGWSREEIINKNEIDLMIPDHLKTDIKRLLDSYIEVGGIHSNINQNLRKDGDIITCRWQDAVLRNSEGSVESILTTAEDITEQVRLAEQFRQAQKMEAVGRLAGGIAHDFNNLLTTILGYSDMILLKQGLDDDLTESVKEIKTSAERAAALTQQLLAFSRKQILQPIVINLNDLIANLSNLLRRLIGEDIDLITELDPVLGQIRADPGQVEQIIMNLVVNARDAMPKGGKLILETQNAVLDESYCRQYPEVDSGDYVLLAVSDTGLGMDEETREHIFEPFFTTKGACKGTGLGLSTVFGIVKQSEGHIWVYSEPGKGTTIKIYFPRIAGAKQELGKFLQTKETKDGTETVLLVEDEVGLRKMAGKILERRGYRVIEASNGKEARETADELGESKLDLLITDVVMPGMSGKDLADMLHEKHPDLRVLYISGYTDNAIAHHGILDKGLSFLPKPFSPQSLAQKVREILDKKKPYHG